MMSIRMTFPAPSNLATVTVDSDPAVAGERAVPLHSLSYVFLLAAVAFLPFNSIRLKGSIMLGDVFVFASFFFLIYEALSRRTLLWFPWWLALSTGLIFLSFLLRAAGQDAGNYDDFVYVLTLIFTSVAVPALIASQRITSPRQIELLFEVWLLASIAGAVAAILIDRGVSLPIPKDWHHYWGKRESGLTLHPNTLGLYCSLAVPACMALALRSHRISGFVLWAGGAAMLLYAIDLSGSRTGMLAAIAATAMVLFLFLVFRKRSEATRQYVWLVVMIVAVLAAFQYRDVGGDSALDRLLRVSRTSALADTQREYIHRASQAAFWEHPFVGNGYRYVLKAHNHALEMLESGGVMGFAGHLIRELGMLAYALLAVKLSLRRGHGLTMAIGLLAVYLCWHLSSIKQTALLERNAFVPLGLAILMCVHQQKRTANAPLSAQS